MNAQPTHPTPAPPTDRAKPAALSTSSRPAIDPAVWQRQMRSLRIIARSLGVVLLTLIARAVITGLTPTVALTTAGTVVLLLACVRLLHRGRQLEPHRHPRARPPEAATYRSTRQHPNSHRRPTSRAHYRSRRPRGPGRHASSSPSVVSTARQPSPLIEANIMNSHALILRPTRHGWEIDLTDGRRLVGFRGPGAHTRALRYLTRLSTTGTDTPRSAPPNASLPARGNVVARRQSPITESQ